MSSPWPWFAGAVALAVVAIGYVAVTGRRFGVSGHVGRVVAERNPRSALFLAGIVVGGFLSAVTAGTAGVHGLDDAYVHIFGATAWPALFVGGVFVGAGTSIAGGCTSGHGLVGCARLEPASLASTACFMGAAVAVSFALRLA